MSQELAIRPVRPEDAEDLRENCFSANTLEQVQGRIAAAIRAADAETEVEGRMVDTGTFVRKRSPFTCL